MTDSNPVEDAWQGKDVAESYDQRRFGTLTGRLSQRLDFRILRRSLHHIALDAPILDLPCGTGRALAFLAQSGFTKLTGTDVSKAMLDVASSRLSGVALVEGDATHTTFANDSFDAVYSMRFFGHVPPDKRVAILQEMARISRGRVVVEIPVTSRTAHIAKRALRRVTVKGRLPKQFDWHVVSTATVRSHATEAGLEVVALRRKLPALSESRYVELRRAR